MKLRHIIASILGMGSALLLSGCKIAVLQPRGVIAADEKQLLIDSVCLMLVIVIPVLILTVLICRRYRASNKSAKYSPNFSHSTTLEFFWWTIPIIIIIILGVMTWKSTHSLDPYKPLNAKGRTITIQAVALRWKWLFIYPEQGIATVNTVELPVNTKIDFLITSDAPMNSFQIPQLGGQIYAMNGMQTKLHLLATSTGDYDGRSVSFSGDGFSDMKFVAHVRSAQAFDQWVKLVKAAPKGNRLTMEKYHALVKPSENVPVQYFASVMPNLYRKIILKFMTPNRHNVDTSELGVHL